MNLQFPSQLKVLLDFVNAVTFGNVEEVLKNVDKDEYARLSALSTRHATDYSLFRYFQKNPSPDLAGEIKNLHAKITQQAIKSLRQLNELIALCRNLNEKGLCYAVIKGPHLARMLYGKEAVKVSVDLDIMVVNTDDLAAFHEVFLRAGYACSEQKLMTGNWKQKFFVSAKREVHYFSREARCAVDLHVKPLANTILTAHRYRNFFRDIRQEAFESITIPVLPTEKYFVYLCYHAACHRFSRLAWLLDIMHFYRQKKDVMDMNRVIAVAVSLHMKRSLWLAFAMMHLLFEVEIPEKTISFSERDKPFAWMMKTCLRAISCGREEDLTLNARFDRMVYLISLNKGLVGKVDVVLSMVMRHLVLLLFNHKGAKM